MYRRIRAINTTSAHKKLCSTHLVSLASFVGVLVSTESCESETGSSFDCFSGSMRRDQDTEGTKYEGTNSNIILYRSHYHLNDIKAVSVNVGTRIVILAVICDCDCLLSS